VLNLFLFETSLNKFFFKTTSFNLLYYLNVNFPIIYFRIGSERGSILETYIFNRKLLRTIFLLLKLMSYNKLIKKYNNKLKFRLILELL